MPNQIMRTGGKDKDNIARGFLTDERGRIETASNTLKRDFLEISGDWTSLDYGEVFRSTLKKSEGYLSSRLQLVLDDPDRSLKVTVLDTTQRTTRTPRVIYDGSPNSYHLNIDFELMADEYYIEVEATHAFGLMIEKMSIEILHNNTLNSTLGFLTDEQGRIETSNTLKRAFSEKTEDLESGEVFRSGIKKSEGYLSSRLCLSLASSDRSLKVTIIDLEQRTTRTPRVIYDGSPNSYHLNIDFELRAEEYYIEVELTHEWELSIHGNTSYEILHNKPLKTPLDSVIDEYDKTVFTKPQAHKRNFLESNVNWKKLNYGEVFRSKLKKSEGYLSSRLQLVLVDPERDLKVTIFDTTERTTRTPRVIFKGNPNGYHLNIDFELMADEYYIEVESTHPYGQGIHKTSIEILHNGFLNLDIEKRILDIEKRILEVKEDAGKKEPTKLLKFKQSPLDIQVVTKGHDDYFYAVDNSGNIKKYVDIKRDDEPVETGINIWEKLGFTGEIVYVFSMEEGITYFINEGAPDRIGAIYHADTINDTPTQVYKSTTPGFWSRHFGVKGYDNGVDSIIFCGLYGGSLDNGLDLLLSFDGGTTFSKVGETRNQLGTTNHWHDVAIDVYSGYLFTSQGDSTAEEQENSSVHYSKDFGKTWEVLSERMQPTAIVPFPDRIVFGRDNFRVGLDYVIKPENPIEDFEEPKELKVFNEQYGAFYFARSGISEGNEAYMTFLPFAHAKNPIIVATGDFGKSWHGVFYSKNNVGNFFYMDDEFVYGYNKEYDGVIYSEKPEWK